MRKLLIAIFILLFWLFCGQAWAATYTVAKTGANAASCIADPPTTDCLTIQYVFDNKNLEPNDIIEVRAGTYVEAVTWGVDDVGTAGNPVILRGYPGETVTINGGANAVALLIAQRSNVSVSNLTVTGGTTACVEILANAGNVSNVTLSNITAQGTVVRGIYGIVTNSYTMSNVVVENSYVYESTNRGIQFFSGDADAGFTGTLHDLTIRKNYVYRSDNVAIGVAPGSSADVIKNPGGWSIYSINITGNTIIEPSSNCILVQTDSGGMSYITNNTCDTAGYGEGELAIGIRTAAADSITISGNNIWGVLSSGAGDGNGITADAFCGTVGSTLTGTCTFTQGSTAVSCANGDLVTEVCPGAYVRVSDGTAYYKVASVTDATNMVLDSNFLEANVTDGANSTVPASWSTNIIIEKNRLHDNIDGNGAGVSLGSCQGCVVKNNIFYGNTRGVQVRHDYSTGNKIFNNTIVNMAEMGIYIYTDTPEVEVKNNLISNVGTYCIEEDSTDPDESNTLCYNPGTAAASGFTIDAGTVVTTDPILTQDYKLSSGSPAINTGDKSVWIGTVSVTDYFGESITNSDGIIYTYGGKVDIGAAQYVYGSLMFPTYTIGTSGGDFTQAEQCLDQDLNPGDICQMVTDITESDGIITIDSNDSGDINSQVVFDLNGYTLIGRITTTGVSYFTLQNGRILNASTNGLYFGGTYGSENPGLIIQDLVIESAAYSGMQIRFKTAPIIRRVVVKNCGTAGANNHDGIYIGQNTTNFLLEDCRVTGQLSDSGSAIDFSDTGADGNVETTTGTINRCFTYDNAVGNGVLKFSSGTDALNTDPDTTTVIVHNSIFVDDDQLVKLNSAGAITIYNTTFYAQSGNTAPLLTILDDRTQTVNIVNTIFTGYGSYGIDLEDHTEHTLTSSHNIFGPNIATGSDRNRYDGDGKTWAEWAALGYDATGSLASDPFLNIGYSLQPGSPAIDAGSNLGSPYNIDFYGRDQGDFGTGWEIGAKAYLRSLKGSERLGMGLNVE